MRSCQGRRRDSPEHYILTWRQQTLDEREMSMRWAGGPGDMSRCEFLLSHSVFPLPPIPSSSFPLSVSLSGVK